MPVPEIQPLTDLKIEEAGGYTLPYSGYIECVIGVPFLEKEIYIPALIVPTTSYSLKVPVVIGTNVIRECWNIPYHIREVPKESRVGVAKPTNDYDIKVQPKETLTLFELVRKIEKWKQLLLSIQKGPQQELASVLGLLPCRR